MTIDIIDYIGKHEDGIIVLISLGYEDEYYEGTFYYRENFVVLTVEERLEKKLGIQIEDWFGYEKIMYDIVSKLVPFEEMINRIDEFNPDDYGLYLDSGTQSDNII